MLLHLFSITLLLASHHCSSSTTTDNVDDNFLDIYDPSTVRSDKDIVLALNLPFTPCKGCRNRISGSGYNHPKFYAAAAAVAVEDVNSNSDLLRGYKLRYVWKENETDTHCDEFEAVRIQLKQLEIGVHGFVGFTCSCLTVAKNAAAQNLPLFSSGCSQTELSNKREFPTFARTTAINTEVVHMITSLFKKFKWEKFAVFYEKSHFWEPIYNALVGYVKRDPGAEITLQETYVKTDTYFNIPLSEGSFVSLSRKIGPFLKKLPHRARVVLLLIERHFIREFMLMAAEKGFNNGDYVFIAVNPFASNPGVLRRLPDLVWYVDWNTHSNLADPLTAGVTPQQLAQAYQSLMVLMPESLKERPLRSFEDRVRKGMSKPPFNSESYKDGWTPPDDARRLYDIVKLYAAGLNRTLARGESMTDGRAIINNIKGLKLSSVNGQRFIVNRKADVQTYFSVLQFQFHNITNDPPNIEQNIIKCGACWRPKEIFKMIPVYNSSQVDLTFRTVAVEGMEPYWKNGVPLDVPVCGFRGEKCPPPRRLSLLTLGLITSLTTLVVLVFLVVLFLYRNHYLRKELNNQMWKIHYGDLYFHDWKGASASSLESLSSLTMGTVSAQRFKSAVIYKGDYVAIKKVKRKTVELTKPVLKELKRMRDVRHNNLNQFIGACVEPGNVMIVYQYAAKGSLQDILENTDVKLDTLFILSLVYDIVKGMLYLHSTDIKYHGNLKSSNCVVDSRWVLKITDYGLEKFKNGKTRSESVSSNTLLWRAPELLRINDETPTIPAQQKGDVYSFAIILQECQTRDGAWGSAYQDPEVIIDRVRKLSNPPYRPAVAQLLDGAEGLRDLMKKCWAESPDARPSFIDIQKDVEAMMKANGLKTNIFDNMIYMMGKYSDNLEDIVAERTSSLIEEKQKVEALLERMLPKSVARQLMKGKEVEAETFEEVTIYFSDIVGFTTICSTVTPMEVVQLLNCLYTMFDRATKDYDVYKVETIGDAYMVVSGLPVRNGKQHVKEICLFSLDILESMKSFKAGCYQDQLKVRIGVHCGPVVAGVVGTTMPRYCLFGDTVNVAARMESTGEALRIQISKDVNDTLTSFKGFNTELRGTTKVKGKGELKTFWLTGSDPEVDDRGANMKRNRSTNYNQFTNSPSIYNFIRDSPKTKQSSSLPHLASPSYKKLRTETDGVAKKKSNLVGIPVAPRVSFLQNHRTRRKTEPNKLSLEPVSYHVKRDGEDGKRLLSTDLDGTEQNQPIENQRLTSEFVEVHL